MLTNLLIALALIVISLTVALNSDRLYRASEFLLIQTLRTARRIKFIAEAFIRAVRHADRHAPFTGDMARYPYYS
jgi:hypothetical protein